MSTLVLKRSFTARNPDEDFVLHGQQPIYRDKPSYMSNSKLTTTTSRLCQQPHVNLEEYRDKKFAHSLGEMAHNLERSSRDIEDTLNRSVTFIDSRPSRDYLRSNHSRTSFDSRPSKDYLGSNYSRTSIRNLPIRHATAEEINRLYDEEFPKAATSDLSPRMSRSKLRNFEKEEELAYPITSHDSLVKEYFPVTLSSSYEFEKMKGDLSKSQSEAVSPGRRSRSLTRTRSALGRLRSDTRDLRYQRLQEPAFEMIERSDVEKMYLMAAEAPRTGSAGIFLTSPFQSEIANLRKERLRIEEERLLELRRLQELENLRPPKEKWYESTGPEFHYECHKNTELQKSNQKWEDTLKKWDDLKSTTSLRNSREKILCL